MFLLYSKVFHIYGLFSDLKNFQSSDENLHFDSIFHCCYNGTLKCFSRLLELPNSGTIAFLFFYTFIFCFQVIFKCCKLIPVLIGGILIQGKRYGLLDVIAACLMSLGNF